MKKRKKKRNRIIGIIFRFLLLLLILALLVVLILALMFKVRNFTITGDTHYTDDEFITASGVTYSDNLLLLDLEGVKENIEKNLPYADNVTVTRGGVGTVSIKAEKAKAAFAVKMADDTFVIMTEKLKTLKSAAALPEGVILIEDVTPVSVREGEIAAFSGDEEEQSQLISALSAISKAASSSLKGIECVNAGSLSSIYLIFEDRIVIKLGDCENISEKLSLAATAISEENQLSNTQTGILNASNPERVLFAAKDRSSIEELAPQGE